jgi:hypothetical protein
MEYIGFVFGVIAFTWCMNLKSQVDRLERILKDNGMFDSEKTSLKEIIEKNIGKRGKIKLENNATDYEILSKNCILKDVDEGWLLLEVEKSRIQKLIRIESIKGIQFK